MLHLLDLPTNILINLIEYLNSPDFYRFLLVCKKLNELEKHAIKFWSRACLHKYCSLDLEVFRFYFRIKSIFLIQATLIVNFMKMIHTKK